MSDITENPTGEANRRRSFFKSTLVIQPPPASIFVDGPPTHTVLAALSSPQNNGKSKTMIRVTPAIQQPAISTSTSTTKPVPSTSSSSDVKKSKDKGTEKKVPSSQTSSKQTAVGKADPPGPTDRAAKARATRLVKLAKLREEKEQAAANPETTSAPDEPRQTRRATFSTSTGRPMVPNAKARKSATRAASTELSSPPNLILKAPKRKIEKPKESTPLKSFMTAGIYCQDDHAKSPYKLVSKVLFRREAEEKAKTKMKIHPNIQVHIVNNPMIPPLPYDYGYELFFGEEREFLLPYDIRKEAESGVLDGKKKPAHYSKLAANKFPERQRMVADVQAICRCDPESDCGDNCINRIMSYLCGKNCPCGARCTNKSLAKRKGASVNVSYTGSRGFGLTAVEDIKEADFVIDYRGEIIGMDTYQERCKEEYAVSKNFYALAYDQDEVIDAGAKGNEARFINHSCNPNMVVQRFQNLGDGQEEYEVGMWALRDIAAGEELSYDYNFDAFGVAEGGARVECRCGAPNCVGYLGRKTGEKSAKQIALDIVAAEAAKAKVARIKSKRTSSGSKNFTKTPSDKVVSGKSRAKRSDRSREPVKAPLSAVTQLPTPESMDSGVFDIPPAVDFNESSSSTVKPVARRSLSHFTRPIRPATRSPSRSHTPQASSSRLDDSGSPSHAAEDDEMTPVRVFSRLGKKVQRKPNGGEPIKPLSGWAAWLKKQAGKYPRTEESWQELKHERRKGEDWMNELIVEYGRLPSKGIPGQVGSVVTLQLLEEKRRELREQGIDYSAKGLRGAAIRSSRQQSVSKTKKRKRASEPAPKKSAQPDLENVFGEDKETEAEAKIRAKQEAIRKRNGAPMGWVYEPVIGTPAQAVDAIPENLPPRRKRAQTLSYAE